MNEKCKSEFLQFRICNFRAGVVVANLRSDMLWLWFGSEELGFGNSCFYNVDFPLLKADKRKM